MSRFATYRHHDYSYGLKNTASRREVPRGGASVLENWDITFKGRLTKRKGLTQYGNTLVGNARLLGFYKKNDGNNYLLTNEGVNLKYLVGATWTNIDTAFTNQDVWYEDCRVEDKIYMSSEDNVLAHWDGATLTKLAASVPHGNVLIWWQNHMFTLNNVNISGTKYKNRIYISNFGDPDTWTTGTDFVDLQGLGDATTANIIGNALVIFKTGSYQFLSGYGLASWKLSGTNTSIQNIDNSVGCPAKRGTTRVSANELWFIDQKGQIRRLSQTDYGYSSSVMSNDIQATIDTINVGALAGAVAYYADEKVYFAVPTGASTVNDTVLVYDLKASSRTNKEAWTTYKGWIVSDMLAYPISSDPELIIAGGTNKKIYRHVGTDDDGVDIACRWDSGLDDYDKPERFKKYTYGYIQSGNQGDIDVDIFASVDGVSFAQVGTFNLQGSGSKLGPTGSFLLGPTGDNRLGGAEDLEYKFYFFDGGGAITGKTVAMSIRYTGDADCFVNGYTNHYVERSLR